MKIAGDPRKVWDITYEETRAIDIGSWFAPEFSSERLPTLEEVLELARGKARVDIELKYYGHDEQLEARVVSIVEDYWHGSGSRDHVVEPGGDSQSTNAAAGVGRSDSLQRPHSET